MSIYCILLIVGFLPDFCRVTDNVVFFIQLKDSVANGQRHVNILVRVSVDFSSCEFWNALCL